VTTIVADMVEVSVFRFVGNRVEYLVLRRSDNEPLYPRLWQLITGIIEDGETALHAVLRELHEETQLVPVRVWAVPYSSSFLEPEKDVLHFVPLFAIQVDSNCEPKLSKEHSAYLWLTFEEALRRLAWPGQKEGLRVLHKFIVKDYEVGKLLEVEIPRDFR